MIIESNGLLWIYSRWDCKKESSEFIWLWIAKNQQIRKFLDLVYQRNEYVYSIWYFLSNLSEGYGKHSVSTDGGTWYLQACKFRN